MDTFKTLHPCCGSSLQQGTKFLAMVSMVMSVVGIFAASCYLLIVFTAGGSKSDHLDKREKEEDEDEGMSLKLLIMLVGFVFNLFLSILLFISAEQTNLRLCRVWFRTTIVLFILDILCLIGSIALSTAEIPDLVINSSGIVYSIYELWVVHAFITEITIVKETDSETKTENTTV